MDILKLLIFLLLVFFIEYNFRFTNLFVEKEQFILNNITRPPVPTYPGCWFLLPEGCPALPTHRHLDKKNEWLEWSSPPCDVRIRRDNEWVWGGVGSKNGQNSDSKMIKDLLNRACFDSPQEDPGTYIEFVQPPPPTTWPPSRTRPPTTKAPIDTTCVLPPFNDEFVFHRFYFIKSDKCKVDEWDVSKVINMKGLFSGANTPPPITTSDSSGQRIILPADLSSWNVSNVTNMEEMFGHRVDHTYQIIGIEKWDVSSVNTMMRTFARNDTFNENITNWDVSKVENMNGMFNGSSKFNQDISNWDVSSVTTMKEMFYNASKFNQDISKWDVSNVIDFSDIFTNSGLDYVLSQSILCTWKDKVKNNKEGIRTISLEIKTDCSTGNTKAIITPDKPTTPGCYYLLPDGCYSWRTSEYDLRNKWILYESITDNAITSRNDMVDYNYRLPWYDPLKHKEDCVTEHMNEIIDKCGAKTKNNIQIFYNGPEEPPCNLVDVINKESDTRWKTIKNKTNFYYTCPDYSKWNITGVKNMDKLIATDQNKIINIGNWDVSKVENMNGMFLNASNFNQDIGKWKVDNVTDMGNMFRGATSFHQDIGKWKVDNVTDMSNMFRDATNFNKDISIWNVDNVKNMGGMFMGALNFKFGSARYIKKWNVKNVTNFEDIFKGSGLQKSEQTEILCEWVKQMTNTEQKDVLTPLNLELTNQNLSCTPPTTTTLPCELITVLDKNTDQSIVDWNKHFDEKKAFSKRCAYDAWDLNGVRSMNNLFNQFPDENINIGTWDVMNVENMNGMFSRTKKFNQDIGNWKVDNVKDMGSMFSLATNFNQDIGNWNVDNVKDMGSMFNSATNFNQDISSWKVGNVADMSYMFSRATNFNQDIGEWKVDNVTDMSYMFSRATKFNQDISSWNIKNVIDFKNIFVNSGIEQELKKKILCSWDTKLNNNSKGRTSLSDVISNSNISCVTTQMPISTTTTTLQNTGSSTTPTSTLQNTGSSTTPTSTLQDTGSSVSRTTPIPTAASDMGNNIRVHLNSSFNDFIKPNYKSQTTTTPESKYSSVKEQNIVLNIDDDLKKFIHNKLDIISSSEDDTNNNRTKFSCSSN